MAGGRRLGWHVTIWDVETGMLHVRCKGGGSRIDAIAFSSDGALLAAGGHGRIQLWDVAGGAFLLDFHESRICLSLAFSPDGRFLASGGVAPASDHAKDGTSQVALWSIENGRGIRTLHGLTTPIARIRFSPEGRYIGALASDGSLRSGTASRAT